MPTSAAMPELEVNEGKLGPKSVPVMSDSNPMPKREQIPMPVPEPTPISMPEGNIFRGPGPPVRCPKGHAGGRAFIEKEGCLFGFEPSLAARQHFCFLVAWLLLVSAPPETYNVPCLLVDTVSSAHCKLLFYGLFY